MSTGPGFLSNVASIGAPRNRFNITAIVQFLLSVRHADKFFGLKLIDFSRLHNFIRSRTTSEPFRHPLLKLMAGPSGTGHFFVFVAPTAAVRLAASGLFDPAELSARIYRVNQIAGRTRYDCLPDIGSRERVVGREVDFDDLWTSSLPMMAFREQRHSVMMQATLSCGDGGAASARVRNISCGGMMAECRFRGAQGDRILISMRGLGELEGSVAWMRHNRIGVAFDEMVDPTAVLRRRSPQRKQTFAPRMVDRAWRPPLQVP